MEFIQTEITHGKLRGCRVAGVNIFKGIPYRGQVSGAQRFRCPAPLQPWTGVRDALELGAPAIQPLRRNEPEPAEDCLFLNIWTPTNDHGKRPVMFYSHGGGFVIGSGSAAIQDGANLARNSDVGEATTDITIKIFSLTLRQAQGAGEKSLSQNLSLREWRLLSSNEKCPEDIPRNNQ